MIVRLNPDRDFPTNTAMSLRIVELFILTLRAPCAARLEMSKDDFPDSERGREREREREEGTRDNNEARGRGKRK